MLLALGVIIIIVVLFMDYYGDEDISITTWIGLLSNVGSGLIGLRMGILISQRYQQPEDLEASGFQSMPKENFPEELIGSLSSRNPDHLSIDDRRKYGATDVTA